MEHATQTLSPITALPQPVGLPDDRGQWPSEAQTAFNEVRRELDRWCRKHDWSPSTNASIAEEAIRQSW
jgi:hypothetical protein